VGISKVKLQRTSGGTSSKGRLPAFRVGQIVRGRVRRILGNGYIRVGIRGQNLVASSEFSVAPEEELLLRVVKLRPRPHLQVLQSMEQSGGTMQQANINSDLLSAFLDRDIPVTYEMLTSAGRDLGPGDLRKFIDLVQRHPEAWRRILWNVSFASGEDLLAFGAWLEQGAALFSASLLARLKALQIPAKILQLHNDIAQSLSTIQKYVQELSADGASTPVVKGMQTHWGQWHLLRNLIWEQGSWYGSFFPFLWENHWGVMAFSYWQPSQAGAEEEPARLSLIAALADGGILQFLLEYRETDLAGAVEVNSGELAMKAEELLPQFRSGLQNKGFSQVGIRVRTIKNMRVDYTQLLPVKQEPLAYAG